jgi:Ca2+-binding EF-hand superfamily protein
MRDTMFKKADANGDNGISLEEFQSVGKKMPIGQGGDADKAFGKIDTDGNGSLSKDEMSAFGDKMSSQMQSMMMKMQEMMSGGGGLAGMMGKGGPDIEALFGKADSDKNGSVSRSEFDSANRENPLSKLLGDRKSEDVFGKIDTDGDGALSKTELSTFSEEMKGKMQAMMGGDSDISTLMQGMNAYGKSAGNDPKSGLVTQLLDMLDSNSKKEKDKEQDRVEITA